MLSLVRRLGPARDCQVARKWRGRLTDPVGREDELGGKTLLIVGLGAVGKRVARIAKALAVLPYVAETVAEFGRLARPGLDRLWVAERACPEERGGQLVGSIAIVGREDASAQLRWFLVHPEARVGVRKIERFREWIHAELDAERGWTPAEIWKPIE